MPEELSQIKINYGPFKALGIWFAKTQSEIIDLNLTNRLKKMESMLAIWRARKLSIKGKICVIRSIILPQIQFLFNMIYIPNDILKKIDIMLFQFIWNNKSAKIKRNTLTTPIIDGGLGMIDIYKVHDTAKSSWIIRLYTLNGKHCSKL